MSQEFKLKALSIVLKRHSVSELKKMYLKCIWVPAGSYVRNLERGWNVDDRASILGHGRAVNEHHQGLHHYCGRPKLDTKRIAEILNEKMWKSENGIGDIK